MKIVVIGASTDAGAGVVNRLCALGHEVTATSRDIGRLVGLDPRAEIERFDIADPAVSAASLEAADRVVSVAHASTVPALIARLPPSCARLVVTGSTMRDSVVPDPRANAVRHSEATFLASGLAGTMLHPTMIYGSRNEANVVRVLRLVDRWPRWLPLVLPVPDGGRNLVQPIHVDDVAAAVTAAVIAEGPVDRVVIAAGPSPFPLADMLRIVAALRSRRLFIVALPVPLLILVARTLRAIFGRSPFSVDELQRTRESKEYDITPLREQLGVEPVDFAEGLAKAYGAQDSVEARAARE